MKSTGIVRNLDGLGRVVVPKETRRVLDMNEGDPVEFYLDGDKIIIQKFQISCVFCSSKEDVQQVLGKAVCNECKEKIGG